MKPPARLAALVLAAVVVAATAAPAHAAEFGWSGLVERLHDDEANYQRQMQREMETREKGVAHIKRRLKRRRIFR